MKPWQELSFVAFDTETTGAYPIGSHICEIGAVMWKGGQVKEHFQELVRPPGPMSEKVIAIHGITNEMVSKAPPIEEVIKSFSQFISGHFLMAHHAPFDMGFLTVAFEKMKLPLPSLPVFCTSLLSREIIPESPNHKLQTLVSFLGLPQRTAHRAYEDAEACLEVGLHCFKRFGETLSVEELLGKQKTLLHWKGFSIRELQERSHFSKIITAVESEKSISLTYEKGSRSGQPRDLRPLGIVRSPNGDFLAAYPLEQKEDYPVKRYYLKHISHVENL